LFLHFLLHSDLSWGAGSSLATTSLAGSHPARGLCAFVPVGFLLLALAILTPWLVAPTGALHGWTTGAIGLMTLAGHDSGQSRPYRPPAHSDTPDPIHLRGCVCCRLCTNHSRLRRPARTNAPPFRFHLGACVRRLRRYLCAAARQAAFVTELNREACQQALQNRRNRARARPRPFSRFKPGVDCWVRRAHFRSAADATICVVGRFRIPQSDRLFKPATAPGSPHATPRS